MPAGVNPANCDPWGLDSFQLFPNFVILIWSQGWYLTYHYWPTSHNTHVFEGNVYFVPATTARERVAQEMAAVTFKEFALQDANTLEATQMGIESRLRRRTSTSTTRRCCADTCTTRSPTGSTTSRRRPWRCGPDDRCCRASSPTSSRSPRSGACPASPSATPNAMSPARWTRCTRSTTPSRHGPRRPSPTSTSSRSTTCPTRRPTSCTSSTRWSRCRSRSRRGASPTCPTPGRPPSTASLEPAP